MAGSLYALHQVICLVLTEVGQERSVPKTAGPFQVHVPLQAPCQWVKRALVDFDNNCDSASVHGRHFAFVDLRTADRLGFDMLEVAHVGQIERVATARGRPGEVTARRLAVFEVCLGRNVGVWRWIVVDVNPNKWPKLERYQFFRLGMAFPAVKLLEELHSTCVRIGIPFLRPGILNRTSRPCSSLAVEH